MTQIIQLAQKQLEIEQTILSDLKAEKEYALDQALKMQNQIPGQQKKIDDLSENLEDLYRKYGYPNGQSGCASASSDIPEVSKSVKPMKKPASYVSKQDVMKAVDTLSPSDYKEAVRLINNLDGDL